jgi:hypothetical protein
MFGAFRYVYIWENRKKEQLRAEMEASGIIIPSITDTAFSDLTDKENPKSVQAQSPDDYRQLISILTAFGTFIEMTGTQVI